MKTKQHTTHPKANRTVVAAILSAAISLGTLGLTASPADAMFCPNRLNPLCDPKPHWGPAPPLPPRPSATDVRPS